MGADAVRGDGIASGGPGKLNDGMRSDRFAGPSEAMCVVSREGRMWRLGPSFSRSGWSVYVDGPH